MKKILFSLVLCALIFLPSETRAQEKQSLSVTPPLFQIDIQPGDTWQSYVKVVNPNPYPLSIYTTPVNFEPTGEEGQGRFVPLVDVPAERNSLATWIQISSDVTVIPPEQTANIPFSIVVPSDASPGGHFAAVLVGTNPPKSTEKVDVETSQVVSSLFMVRIAGDVVEKGSVREFSTEHSFYNSPNADFVLRFENQGTVHIQPQGDITIFNMWGKERGYIPINQKTHFGNVLPKSIRKFSFSWSSESSLADIGRYKAVATLTYGTTAKQSDYATVYFWVIPVKATLITLAFIIGLVLFLMFVVRLYIRRAIALAGYEPVSVRTVKAQKASRKKEEVRISRKDLALPLRKGVVDLRTTLTVPEKEGSRFANILSLARQYKWFLVSVGVGALSLVFIVGYFASVLTSNRSFEVTLKQPEGSVTISSEEVIHDRLKNKEGGAPLQGEVGTSGSSGVAVRIVNASGENGVGARVALLLEKNGYTIDGIANDKDIRDRSVVVYEQQELERATKLAALIPNALLSSFVPNTASSTEHSVPITLFLGSDARE